MKVRGLTLIKVMLLLAAAAGGLLVSRTMGVEVTKWKAIATIALVNLPLFLLYFYLSIRRMRKISGNRLPAAQLAAFNIVVVLIFAVFLAMRFEFASSSDFVIGSLVMLMIMGALAETIVNYMRIGK